MKKPAPWLLTCVGVLAISGCGGGNDPQVSPNPGSSVDSLDTATPIKHVLIIVGENRSFDHLFATYVPKNPDETVLNLLSEQIINADGSPGLNYASAHQYQIVAPPNGGRYFSSASLTDKQLYALLPPPDLDGTPAEAPTAVLLTIPDGEPGLLPQDQYLLGTGGTGLGFTFGPDTRIANVTALPPGPFQLTGPMMPFDAFTADTVHEFFQMVQQLDCAIDSEHVSAGNPTGCRHDLLPAVGTTWSTPPGSTPHDTGQSMGFFNMSQGDAPYIRLLADTYTLSDNYHQPVMGGTGPDSAVLGFADEIFFSDGAGHPLTPPSGQVFNPDPTQGTHNYYTRGDAEWFSCADDTQPGIAAIATYLRALPYAVPDKCGAGEYWPAVNLSPPFTPKGSVQGGLVMPPTTQRSIGDVLSAHQIAWKYYGGGFNQLGTQGPYSDTYCSICNPFEYEAVYPTLILAHMRDVTDLYEDLAAGTLPAVSWVKPDAVLDGHPQSSKWTLFEAFLRKIIGLAQSNPRQWSETAIFITVDESGGFYDSGFIQPVDFFGTGPRIPLVAVSPFSAGGRVSHVYNEHSSFVKFIERNWRLGETLSARSRDNLPNPVPDPQDAYVPANMPAIGDLFDMFQFAPGP